MEELLAKILGEGWMEHREAGLKILSYVHSHPNWVRETEETPEDPLKAACIFAFDIPWEKLMSADRNDYLVIRRMAICWYLFRDKGMPNIRIAEIMGKTHPTITYYIMRCAEMENKDKKFVELYNKFKNSCV